MQYQIQQALQAQHEFDNMDSATSNVGGAVASVIAAVFLAKLVDDARRLYYAKILGRDSYLDKDTALGKCFFSFMTCFVRFGNFLHLGRKSEKIKLAMQDKVQKALKNFKTTGESVTILSEEEEKVFVETIVSAENLNICMPTSTFFGRVCFFPLSRAISRARACFGLRLRSHAIRMLNGACNSMLCNFSPFFQGPS